MSPSRRSVLRLTESAVLLAVATVLSIVKLIELPYGGSITACSLLPVLILAYRHGIRWGTLSAFVFSLIQLLLGMQNLSYATSFWAILAILLLDYGFAFTALGLGALFRKSGRSQARALALGAVVTGAVRYACHVISGCTVWAGLSIPSSEALLYSLSYNACFMVPEIGILLLGAVTLSQYVSFEGENLRHAGSLSHRQHTRRTAIRRTLLLGGMVVDVLLLAPHIQDAETGMFSFAALKQADWPAVAIVSATAGMGFIMISCLAHRKEKA